MIAILWVFAALYAAYMAFALCLSRLLNGRPEGGHSRAQADATAELVGRDS
jgi:hypothetical protein